jgi:hypothetical protein
MLEEAAAAGGGGECDSLGQCSCFVFWCYSKLFDDFLLILSLVSPK